MSLKIHRRVRDGYPRAHSLEAPSWLKPLRNVLLSALLMLLLLVGLGLLYTWYVDSQPKNLDTAEKTSATKTTAMKAPAIDPNAPVGVAVQSLSSPVAPGENASLTIRTKPTAICHVEVSYTGVPTTTRDSGLGDKKADEFGVVIWSWTIPTTAQKALSPVSVRCELDDKSGEFKTAVDVRPI